MARTVANPTCKAQYQPSPIAVSSPQSSYEKVSLKNHQVEIRQVFEEQGTIKKVQHSISRTLAGSVIPISQPSVIPSGFHPPSLSTLPSSVTTFGVSPSSNQGTLQAVGSSSSSDAAEKYEQQQQQQQQQQEQQKPEHSMQEEADPSIDLELLNITWKRVKDSISSELEKENPKLLSLYELISPFKNLKKETDVIDYSDSEYFSSQDEASLQPPDT